MLCKVLVKGFPKNTMQPPFLVTEKIRLPSDNGGVSNGNQIFLVTIKFNHTATIRWQPKNFIHPRGHGGDDFFSKIFNHHLTYPHLQMATERGGACVIILGKKNHPPFYILSDQRISIAIQWCGYVGWRSKKFNRLKSHGSEGHEMAIKTRGRYW
jgi:hypothetical protein